MAVRFIKDSDEVLDYSLDFSQWLISGDYIVAATFIPSPGLNVISTNYSNTIATVWLSGGIPDQTYSVTGHVTTNGGRQVDRTFQIVCRNQ